MFELTVPDLYLYFSHRQLIDCFGVFNITLYGMFTLSATETDAETETDTDIDKIGPKWEPVLVSLSAV